MDAGHLRSARFLSTTSSTASISGKQSHSQYTSHDDVTSDHFQLPIIPSSMEDNPPVPEMESTVSSVSTILANTGAHYLEDFHNFVSMHDAAFGWGPSLMLSAVAIRLFSLPLVYYNQIHTDRFALAAKELPRVQAFVRQTPGTLWQKYRTFRRLRSLTLRSAGTSSMQLFRWDLMVHLPVVVSASMGVRQLASSAPDAWKTGGLVWFPDLTSADPTGLLPVITTAFWLWNSNPRSPLKQNINAKDTPDPPTDAAERGSPRSNAAMTRIMNSRGEWLSTLLQIVSVASLTVTMHLPSGMILLWASNGAVTALQRWALSNESVRRHVGLLTTEDVLRASGPPVLQSTKTAIDQVRRELEYVQREVLARFPNREVDSKLRDEVNRVLNRERWNGRISMQLEAVIREDDRDGRKYIAVIRKGTA